MRLKFTKMQAAGNDFIVIDEFGRMLVPDEKKPEIVRKLSDRHFGIGSDGVIFVQKPSGTDCDATFIFYNPDGSIAEMCGNGIRCFARYVYEKKYADKKIIRAKTHIGVITVEIIDGSDFGMKVDMGAPQFTRGRIGIKGDPSDSFINRRTKVGGRWYDLTSVGMGNPHTVIFLDDIERMDVRGLGQKVRHLKSFKNGTNVHFVKIIRKGEMSLRTYERGVEDETLACGTGVCASSVASVLAGFNDSGKPILVHARGGDLKVSFGVAGGKINRVYLTGSAEKVFEGVIEI